MPKIQNKNWLYLATLGALTIAGFWLRYRCLGCLGFRGDEDLTSLAVKALSATGVPELPSGMIYLRFLPYQEILAQSTKLLGFSEFSIRLPSVFLGTFLIPTAYYIASKLTDKKIGLLVALGIALSFSQVEVSRAARMYAPFYLIYAFAAYTIFRAHFANTERHWSPLALILCLATLSIHQLGYSLAILFLVAIPLNPTLPRSAALVAQSALVAAAFLGIKQIQEHYFYQAIGLADPLNTSEPVVSDGGLISSILNQVAFPDLSLLTQIIGSSIILTALYLAIIFTILIFFWRNSSTLGVWQRAIGMLALILAAVHQFNLSLIMLGLMIVVNRKGLETLRERSWLIVALSAAGLFVLWMTLILAISTLGLGQFEITDIGIRKLIRLLFDYPNFRLFWSFVIERPILALPLVFGTLWAIEKSARTQPKPEALFLLGVFWAVLFANGVLKTKFEVFRYNLHIDIFFLMLATIGIIRLPNILDSLGWSGFIRGRSNATSPLLIGVATALVFVSVRPDFALMTSSRGYYEDGAYYELAGMSRYPDFGSAAAYVREQMQDGDVIFVFDPREYWNYIGRVDYWIYSDNYQSQTHMVSGIYRDLYVDVPLLHTLADVENTLAGIETGNAWILYTGTRMERSPWISQEIKSFVTGLDEQIVFTGRDQDTRVIRLTAGDTAPRP